MAGLRMSDPRLNSIHLDAPRRELFRRAREGLLNARGWQTVAAEASSEDESAPDAPHTMLLPPDAAPPPDVDFWLIDKDGLYPLKIGLNTVGRAPENDVVVPDAYVSRRHCAILVHAGDGCELHDIASKNGTYLNGRRLEGPTPLNRGDESRMCDRQMVFMNKTGGAAAEGNPPTEHG